MNRDPHQPPPPALDELKSISPPKGRWTMRRVATGLLSLCCWGALIIASALWLFLRLEGDRWWVATIFLFGPRWVCLLLFVPFVPFVLWLKRSLMLPLGVALLICYFGVVGGEFSLLGFLASWSNKPTLRLMTFNAHRHLTDANKMAALLFIEQPDVVVLQDWSDAIGRTIFGNGGWYVHRNDEVLIASRYPIIESQDLRLTDLQLPEAKFKRNRSGTAVHYVLDVKGKAVHLINIHLASPHHHLESFLDGGTESAGEIEANSQWRAAESAVVRRCALEVGGPVIVAGDFNTPKDGAVYHAAWGDFDNAFTTRGVGIGYTHISRKSQVRIDHIVTRDWSIARSWVGPDLGSPHRPLFADVNWQATH